MNVTPIHTPSIEGLKSLEPAPQTKSVDLATTFSNALREASELEQSSNSAATKFASGDPSVGIHEVMIASEEANIALRFATTLKNKALDAYRELMATQV